MANRVNGIADKMPPSLSLTVFTNFPFRYDPPGFTASPSEHAFGLVCNPKYEVQTLALSDLEESLKKIGKFQRMIELLNRNQVLGEHFNALAKATIFSRAMFLSPLSTELT